MWVLLSITVVHMHGSMMVWSPLCYQLILSGNALGQALSSVIRLYGGTRVQRSLSNTNYACMTSHLEWHNGHRDLTNFSHVCFIWSLPIVAVPLEEGVVLCPPSSLSSPLLHLPACCLLQFHLFPAPPPSLTCSVLPSLSFFPSPTPLSSLPPSPAPPLLPAQTTLAPIWPYVICPGQGSK